ncbi:ribbon-helix-helix domain-containing protein [soil metagenome]
MDILTYQYNKSYTNNMKTAISIPDNVYETAEKLANRLGKSRSQLYTQALSSYLAKHQKDEVTQKLDEIYGEVDSKLDNKLAHLQFKSVPKEKW